MFFELFRIVSILFLIRPILCISDVYGLNNFANIISGQQQLLQSITTDKFKCLKACANLPDCNNVVIGSGTSKGLCQLFKGCVSSTQTSNNLLLYNRQNIEEYKLCCKNSDCKSPMQCISNVCKCVSGQ